MTLDRRTLLSAGLGTGLAAGLVPAAATAAPRPARAEAATGADSLDPHAGGDRTAELQALIDRAAERGAPVLLPPGRFRCSRLVVRAGTRISGAGAATVLEAIADPTLIDGTAAHDVSLSDFALDGGHVPPPPGTPAAVIRLQGARHIALSHLVVTGAGGHAILLDGCGGTVSHCRIAFAADAAIHALDSTGLAIIANDIADCGNNGIQVWRRATGEDGTQIDANRIARIAARSGGSGQNGNGINVYRAGSVAVTGNRIIDCAYSAIRGNAASNLRIVANGCQRLGEVAIYAEFGFEGALVASNLVDGAATGISVTNFDVGGRLAVIHANLIRNLVRREREPVDKRGEGIAVEADASITGNTIENAPTAGLVIGWGRHMRDCVASGNLIRNARIGIMVSSDPEAGAVLVTSNMISGSRDGAIRAMTRGQPHGPDLARSAIPPGRVTITGNAAV